MKKLAKLTAVLAALAVALSFTACENDDDDASSSFTPVPLPPSVGDNPYSGRAWQTTYSIPNYAYSVTISCTDTTITVSELSTQTVDNETSTYTHESTYNYSYNTETSLVYMALIKESVVSEEGSYSWTSPAEYEQIAIREGDTGAELAAGVAEKTALFNTPTVYKYDISDSELTIAPYFDGKLPTMCQFSKRSYDNATEIIFAEDGGLGINIYTNDTDVYWYIYPTFSDGTFSGTLFKEDENNENWETLGTANGTYTVSGTGTEDCTLTITFTDLPSSVTEFAKDTAFTLSLHSESVAYTELVN